MYRLVESERQRAEQARLERAGKIVSGCEQIYITPGLQSAFIEHEIIDRLLEGVTMDTDAAPVILAGLKLKDRDLTRTLQVKLNDVRHTLFALLSAWHHRLIVESVDPQRPLEDNRPATIPMPNAA